MDRAKTLLNSVTVSSIKKLQEDVVTLCPNDSIEHALKKLSDWSISSAPVFDPNQQKIIGALSVLDLVVWVVRTYSTTNDKKNFFLLKKEFDRPIRELLQYGVDPFWPVSEDTTLATLINCYFKWRIHRAPVIHGHKFTGHVSQSDVIDFLASHSEALGSIMENTVEELGLSEGPVLSILKGMPLIDVFSNILETRYTGIAIVTATGELYNSISASDLKGITVERFHELEKPIETILKDREKLPPVTCKSETTLGEVIKTLSDYRVHRVFVVNKQGCPTNVITNTTIMKIFSPASSECFG